VIPLKDDNPVDRTPLVTFALAAANVLAFLWQIDLPMLPEALRAGVLGQFIEQRLHETALRGGAVPYEILTFTDIDLRAVVPPPLTILTSMFLHGGFGHIAFNMLFLWIFGNNVEDALGRRRFLLFYLACGVAAALVQIVASAMQGEHGDPRALQIPMVGASGAIAGVLAAYMLLFPSARVLTLVIIIVFVRVIALPASIVIGLWFAGQLIQVLLGANTGVAFFAHIGGFVAGLLLIRVVGRRPRWRARRVVW
jgi:membrane associated rhomboid family serine protease